MQWPRTTSLHPAGPRSRVQNGLTGLKVEFLLQLWRTIHFRASSESPHESLGPWPLLLFKACNKMPSDLNQFQHSFIRTQRIIQHNLISISLITPVNAFILFLFKTADGGMSVVEGPFYFLIFIGVHVPATELVWRSEGNFVESVSPFHLHVGFRD